MAMVINGACVYRDGALKQETLFVIDGRIVSSDAFQQLAANGASVLSYSFSNCVIIPGFTDVHVHLREPGFSYKETIRTGTAAAAHGGYTAVCAMPNLKPSPDTLENLSVQLDAIKRDASVRVYPYGTITMGSMGESLSKMEELAPHVIGFTDDGRGVQSEEMMEAAMRTAKRFSRIIAAHCEEASAVGGALHDGPYAARHALRGIPSATEWRQLERDLRLAQKTGCAYHVCHVSTKESVALIRQAKAAGVDVTAETAPHYLVLTDEDVWQDARMKMNPPLRTKEDREALLEGVADGTIDMIATDHAPHSPEEKARGLALAPMGVTGLECAFPVLYTELVCGGILTLEELIEKMTSAPRRRFGIPGGTSIGDEADFTVFDLNTATRVDSSRFLSAGKSTPFDGRKIHGICKMTVAGGKIVWQEKQYEN